MRLEVVLIAFLLSGCVTGARYPTALESCGLSLSGGWAQVKAPIERNELMRLIPRDSESFVEKHLSGEGANQEVWFRHSDGRVLACAYTAGRDSCSGGVVLTVEFEARDGFWEAAHALEEVCVTSVLGETHNKRLQNDRQNARRFASLPLVGGV